MLKEQTRPNRCVKMNLVLLVVLTATIPFATSLTTASSETSVVGPLNVRENAPKAITASLGTDPSGTFKVLVHAEPSIVKVGETVNFTFEITNSSKTEIDSLSIQTKIPELGIDKTDRISSIASCQTVENSVTWTPEHRESGTFSIQMSIGSGDKLSAWTPENIMQARFRYKYDGKSDVIILYKNNPPVHSWIALQAYLKLTYGTERQKTIANEIKNYLETNPLNDIYDAEDFDPETLNWDDDDDDFFTRSTSLIEGTWEEDEPVLKERFMHHFWDPEGSYDTGYNEEHESALERAQEHDGLWNSAISAYARDSGNTYQGEAYYRLGRISHLLMDMSVPAHTLLDPHHGEPPVSWLVGDDNYEEYTGNHYKTITASSVTITPIGSVSSYGDDPSSYDQELSNLFFSEAEISNDFDSDDRDGQSRKYGKGKYTCQNLELDSDKTVYDVQLFFDKTWPFDDEYVRSLWRYDGTENPAHEPEYDIYKEGSNHYIFYYRSFYEKYNNDPDHYIKIVYSDGSNVDDKYWGIGTIDVPEFVLKDVYQPELQVRAIHYTAKLYELFWERTHRTITGVAEPGGTILPLGNTEVRIGTDLKFTATRETNYVVDKWTWNGNKVQDGGNEYELTDIQENGTVKVYFEYVSPPEPEINIKGNNQTIPNDDDSPTASDGRDFGSADISVGTVIKTFTIENTGNADLNLTGNPKVSIGGTNASDFTATQQPSSPVSPSDTTTFKVEFDPSEVGIRNATISIANNDSDKNPYTFNIKGEGIDTDEPIISQNPSALTPSCEEGQNADADIFQVGNSGSGTLSYTINTPASGSWISSITPENGTSTGGNNEHAVTYNTSGLSASESPYTATITITDSNANNSPQIISVTLTVSSQEIPILDVSPTTQDVAYISGTTEFEVSNTGNGTMTWTASVTEGKWISITSGASGRNIGKIVCSFEANTGVNERTGTITVSAPNATPNTIDVKIKQTGYVPGGNDDLSNAIGINSSSGQASISNENAGKETGEPNHAGNEGGHSMWWTWTAPSNGTMTLDTRGSDFDTLLAVYTGNSVDALTEIGSNDDARAGQTWSSVAFNAISGTTYQIAVDGKDNTTGGIVLNWSFAPATLSRLSNISTRRWVGLGDDMMIVGFIVGGSQPTTVSVVGWGLSLEELDVPNVVKNPELMVCELDGTVIAKSINWTDTKDSKAFVQAQMSPTTSSEVMLDISDLAPGAYTAILRGHNGEVGNGLLGIWDTSASPQLTNLSTRGIVGLGHDVMIAGFIIEGATTKTVAVTGWGPRLAGYGVPDVLDDPQLMLYTLDGEFITQNDNWRGSEFENSLTTNDVAPSDDLEAGIVVMLSPGAYTAILSSADSITTGNGLVAVWDLD